MNASPEIESMLAKALEIQRLARSVGIESRPDYHFAGREVLWGQDLPLECMEAMRTDSEVVMVRREDKSVYGYLLMDSYGQLRDYKVAV